MNVLATAELAEAAAVEEARLDSIFEADEFSSEDVAVADGRKDEVAVGACERSEGLSSWRRTAG
jgi:hypothetical protein